MPASSLPQAPRRRWRWTLIVVLLAAAAAAAAWRLTVPAAAVGTSWRTTPIIRGSVQQKVTASGALSALVTVSVGSQVSGRIEKVLVDYNAEVKKGQVLARIDTSMFTAALEQARANLLIAQAGMRKARLQQEDAERTLARQTRLAAAHLVTDTELDAARTAADLAAADSEAAKGSLAQAQAAVNQAKINLGYTTIVSPIDGVVIARSIDEGQTVAASLQAPELFIIAEDLRRMQVDTSVAEADVGQLEAGMKVLFSVDAYPQDIFEGTVHQIRYAATTVQNVVTYNAVVHVENPDLKLKPGMTADVTFIVAARDNVLLVPGAALRFRPTADQLAPSDKAGQPGAEGPGGGGLFGGGGAPPAGPPPGGGGPPRSGGGGGSGLRVVTPVAATTTAGAHPAARTLWIVGPDGAPRSISVAVGVSDGKQTEITGGDVQEGMNVIIGVEGEATQSATTKSSANKSRFGRYL